MPPASFCRGIHKLKSSFLTVHDDSTSLFEAIRAGARGYILKNVPVAQLLRLIRGVEDMMNKILDEFVHLSQTSRLTLPAIQSLSPREYEVDWNCCALERITVILPGSFYLGKHCEKPYTQYSLQAKTK